MDEVRGSRLVDEEGGLSWVTDWGNHLGIGEIKVRGGTSRCAHVSVSLASSSPRGSCAGVARVTLLADLLAMGW